MSHFLKNVIIPKACFFIVFETIKIIFTYYIIHLYLLIFNNIFGIFMGDPVKIKWLFWLLIFLGSIGFSIAFTFISAITGKAKQSASLMAILSFPVIIPILITLIRLSKIALRLMIFFFQKYFNYKHSIVCMWLWSLTENPCIFYFLRLLFNLTHFKSYIIHRDFF